MVWLFAFGGAAWRLRRIRKQADARKPERIEIYAMGFEIGLYGWFIGGFFHDFHNVDPAFWLVAFTVALVRLRKKREREPEPEASEMALAPEPSYV